MGKKRSRSMYLTSVVAVIIPVAPQSVTVIVTVAMATMVPETIEF